MQNTPLERVEFFFTRISQSSLPQIRQLYAADAYFKDPFNEVTGIANIEKIFAHMFIQVKTPKFEIVSSIGNGSGQTPDTEAFLVWLFHWKEKEHAKPIRGSSHIKFNQDGQVVYHRDYWDAAEELYETIPVLGGLMRWIKKKLAA
jgi:steroid Delta-isomerase